MTLTGTNFPQSLTSGTFSVTFGGNNKCLPVSVSPTQLKCITESLKTSPTGSITMTVAVNGKTDATKSVTKRTDPTTVESVSPSSVSPVLKATLTLTVNGYSSTLDKDDLEVWITSKTKAGVRYNMNVVETGPVSGQPSRQYIKVKFGGADSDTYNFFVRSRSYGSFDASSLTFTTVGKITGFSPKHGSIHGGSLITIDGYHFSATDIQDNPVRIGYTDCLVESTTATQIKCRTVARHENEVGTDEVIVLLKTYEEADCAVSGGCNFNWVDSASVTSHSTAYDATANDYVMTITGTGFQASNVPSLTNANTKVHVDDLEQQTLSVSNTQIKVKLNNLKSFKSLDIDIYLPIG